MGVLLLGAVLVDDGSGNRLSAALNSSDSVIERLVVHYANGDFELVSRTTLNKVLPRSTALPAGTGGTAGAWYEVQDNAGKVLYRRFMPSVLTLRCETADSTNPGIIHHTEVPVSESNFSILVPTHFSPRTLVFFDGARSDKTRAPSTEIGRLPLG